MPIIPEPYTFPTQPILDYTPYMRQGGWSNTFTVTPDFNDKINAISTLSRAMTDLDQVALGDKGESLGGALLGTIHKLIESVNATLDEQREMALKIKETK